METGDYHKNPKNTIFLKNIAKWGKMCYIVGEKEKKF